MKSVATAIQCGNLIGGKWEQQGADGIKRVNPAHVDDLVATAPDSSAEDARRAIQAAADAFQGWRRTIPPQRGKIVLRAAQLLESRLEEVAQLLTREEGKILSESRAEVQRAIDIMEYASGMGRRLGGQTLPTEAPHVFCFTTRQPIGPVAAISPWNFPVAIPCWKLAPALVCGNTVVCKPSPLTPATATRVVEIFEEAGLPPGVLNLVHGGAQVGSELVNNPLIRGISFTGSTAVGKAIHAAAAQRLAKVQLEMGGKNPQIILRDANLESAVRSLLTAAFGSTGQRCSATSRAIVERKVAGEVVDRLVEGTKAIRMGPGDQPDVTMGPLVGEFLLRNVKGFIERARAEGTKMIVGGCEPEGLRDGYYYAPTIVGDVRPEHEIAREEVFGPVLSFIEVDDLDEALTVANTVDYGLCASIFTKDIGRAFTFVDKIEAGMIHVNRPGLGGFSHMPFGGFKHSSYGSREVGDDTINFYTDMKSVHIQEA
ncbi:MAG: aldehyde dehydrogenase family protein [candidate division NC10 bacterium]|nr:aldehyde dehydrogenase family protein [candidate division NC10 bacterium]